jgi:UDP-N-acetylglucosamine 4-epimerase
MQEITGSRVLVTGGAGFIGSNLVTYLIENGVNHVRVLDNLSTGHYKNIAKFEKLVSFEFIEGDIRDLETCQNACEGMDYVLHQAALGSVPRSINDPITSNDVNVSGFLNMLVAVRDHKVKRMVYAASSSTYGDSKGLPKVEDKIGRPLSPYAVTKFVNELYADVFAKTYEMEIIGLRYFNVFGPNQDPNGAYAAVIPKFIDLLLNNQAPVINGDGTISRDFTYVDNAVQANMKAMLSDNAAAINQVYNVACGNSTTLNKLVSILKEETKSSVKITHAPNRVGDIEHSLADVSKAKEMISYIPEVDINEGLKRTVDWFKNGPK